VSLLPYRDGHVHVLAEQCSTCVFRPGNPMHLQPGRLAELVDHNRREGAALVCHKTLPYGDHPEVGQAICRGYFDAYKTDTVLALAEALHIIREVPTP
jgi:hypothetical protein